MPHTARVLALLALVIVSLGQAIAATPAAVAGSPAMLPIMGFGGTMFPGVVFIDLVTLRTATVFYYYQREAPNDIFAGALPYSRSGSLVRINGMLNPSGDPRDDRRLQWSGSADVATGAINLSAVNPAGGAGVTITTTSAASSVSQAGMIGALGFVLYTMRRWDLAYLLGGEHARAAGPANYASRQAALFNPPELRGWHPQLGADGLTILMHGATASVQGNLYYTHSGHIRALACTQQLAIEQHGWRLEAVGCAAMVTIS